MKSLRTIDLVKVYRGRRVVDKVSVEVHQGEVVGLLGPNGAGKTTTFYMITGMIRPNSGQILYDDRDVSSLPMYKRARMGVGYLCQEPSIFRKMTVEENILAILEILKISKEERKRRLEHLLEELSITHVAKQKADTLSGGERRRLEISRALVTDRRDRPHRRRRHPEHRSASQRQGHRCADHRSQCARDPFHNRPFLFIERRQNSENRNV